ncbi:MAG: 6-carboxytetrahydropterin synthase [Saprospiraceae bacterium]|nr:6-carboxytetrahydropterin synthase [Candidatus Brachybacter algidus]
MAHAIYGYSGACKDIHGHSYELHVSVCSDEEDTNYIPAPAF